MNNAGFLLPTLYRLDPVSGWSAGMRAISHTLLGEADSNTGPILELGCGGGVFAQELATHYTTHSVVATDRLGEALAVAQQTAAAVQLAQADLHDLPFGANTFSLVTAMDVLDQRGVVLTDALREIRRVLYPGGRLLLRVSANRALEGPHDVAFSTGQRYSAAEMSTACYLAGFDIHRLTFANSLLAPPVMAIRLLQRWEILPWTENGYEGPLAHALFSAALRLEARWLAQRNLPVGVSLYVLAGAGTS